MPSVFLCHSNKDKDFAQELFRRLTRDGVDCFFDAESIGWGDNRVRALERALGECTDIVFVLSPDFCNSEWAEAERTSRIADDASGSRCRPRPLILRECSDLPTFPRFLKQIQTLDVSTREKFEANYEKICHELGGTIVRGVETTRRGELPAVQPLPERHRMPFHSLGDRFVGWTDSIWQVYGALHRGSTTVVQGTGILAGAGGLGKSQAAAEYVHRFGTGYRGGVYWVDYDRGLSALVSQVSEAAGLAIDTKAEERVQTAALDGVEPHAALADRARQFPGRDSTAALPADDRAHPHAGHDTAPGFNGLFPRAPRSAASRGRSAVAEFRVAAAGSG